MDRRATVADARTEETDGPPSSFTCPACHGPLWESEHGGVLRYLCRVGHAWSEQAMQTAQTDDVEDALWTAVRALRERAAMADRLAERAVNRGLMRAVRSHEQYTAELREHAQTIQGSLETLRRSGQDEDVPFEGSTPSA